MHSIGTVRVLSRSAHIAILTAPLLLLAFSGIASATPIIGNEFPIANVFTSALLTQQRAAAAAGGPGYLVVWEDKRNGANFDIYGILVDTEGNPVSGESFLISSVINSYGQLVGADNDQTYADVAFNGSQFLVVWADKRAKDRTPHIYGARVTTTGEVLDPEGILISLTSPSSTSYGEAEPAVASRGPTSGDWQVVWTQTSSTGSLRISGRVVYGTGSLGTIKGISSGVANQYNPAIAWNGSNYLLAWEDVRTAEDTDTDIYGCRVDTTGSKITNSEKLISCAPGASTTGAPGPQTSPAVAAKTSTGNCLVVWQDGRNDPTPPTETDIYGMRVSSSGVLDSGDVSTGGIAISTEADSQENPSVGWDGSNFLVAWRHSDVSRSIKGRTVSTSAMLGPVMDISPHQTQLPSPAVACQPGTSLVVWHNLDWSNNNDVWGRRISSSGSMGSALVIGLSLQDQAGYDMAFDGTNFVAVWSDKRSGQYAIYAARIALDGTVLDPQGVLVSYSTSEQTQPCIAWSGSEFLVAWKEGTGTAADIKGMRLTSGLTPIGSKIGICDVALEQSSPAVAWNGTDYLVVWADARYGIEPDYFTDIYGARIDRSTGAVYPLASRISNADAFYELNPCVTSDGDNFLVAWQDYRNGYATIYCTRVSRTGTVLSPNGVKVPSVSATALYPDAAFDGTNYCIIWADYRNGSTPEIYAGRVSRTGTVVAGEFRFCTNSTYEAYPRIIWDGREYVAVWQQSVDFTGSVGDIYMRRMNADGSFVDGSPILVSGNVIAEITPCIASKDQAKFAIAYRAYYYSVGRMRARFADEPPIYDKLADVKAAPDGTVLTVVGKVVSAGTDELTGTSDVEFYIEETDRTAGLKVVGATGTVQEGKLVTITGRLTTLAGERRLEIISYEILPGSGIVPAPFAMRCLDVGGASLNAYTPGVKYGYGPNNIGLLIKTWGKVVQTGSDSEGAYFVIDDGSVFLDPNSNPPYQAIPTLVKVRCPVGVTLPTVSGYVTVVGVSSCEPSGQDSIRRVLVRKQSDILP